MALDRPPVWRNAKNDPPRKEGRYLAIYGSDGPGLQRWEGMGGRGVMSDITIELTEGGE